MKYKGYDAEKIIKIWDEEVDLDDVFQGDENDSWDDSDDSTVNGYNWTLMCELFETMCKMEEAELAEFLLKFPCLKDFWDKHFNAVTEIIDEKVRKKERAKKKKEIIAKLTPEEREILGVK